MKFEEFTLSELVSFTFSDRYERSTVIPVTRHRAISQARNPRASPEDVVLIIAWNDQDEIIGYTGALPDWINGDMDKKAAWNSCWWADPVKGREAAMPLLYRFIDRWKGKVMFSELTPGTFQIISRIGFFESRIISGSRGYLRLPLSEILPEKKDIFRLVRWLLYAVDTVFNLFWELRLIAWTLLNQQTVKWQFAGSFDDEINSLVDHSGKNDLSRRGASELTWIRDYPWVLEGRPDSYARRYHFTSHARHVQHQWVKIECGHDIRAFMVVTIRDGHLRIPCLYNTPGSMPGILNFLLHYMIGNKVLYISIYRSDLADYIMKSKTPFLFKKRIRRYFALSKELTAITHENYILQDGDGDCIFT